VEQYRPIWEQRFDRLDDYLEEIQPEEKRVDQNKTEGEQHGRTE
jgi:hypothetical protein